jgi:hypothetical protein
MFLVLFCIFLITVSHEISNQDDYWKVSISLFIDQFSPVYTIACLFFYRIVLNIWNTYPLTTCVGISLFYCFFFFILFFFEMESHCISQAGSKPLCLNNPPALATQLPRTTGILHTWLTACLLSVVVFVAQTFIILNYMFSVLKLCFSPVPPKKLCFLILLLNIFEIYFCVQCRILVNCISLFWAIYTVLFLNNPSSPHRFKWCLFHALTFWCSYGSVS